VILSRISHSRVVRRLEPIVRNLSPYRPIFTSRAPFRALLEGFDVPLHTEGFEILCSAVRNAGEDTFVYGKLERLPADQDDWVVSCKEYTGYRSVEVFVESFLSSVNGEWVVLCSSEGHSVAASMDARFIETLTAKLGKSPRDQADSLARYWRGIYGAVQGSDLRAGPPDWIPTLFEQILDRETAESLLEQHADWLRTP
jgi:hypothetical protein